MEVEHTQLAFKHVESLLVIIQCSKATNVNRITCLLLSTLILRTVVYFWAFPNIFLFSNVFLGPIFFFFLLVKVEIIQDAAKNVLFRPAFKGLMSKTNSFKLPTTIKSDLLFYFPDFSPIFSSNGTRKK